MRSEFRDSERGGNSNAGVSISLLTVNVKDSMVGDFLLFILG